MRPKDLQFPSTWEKRHPEFFKNIFVVPRNYGAHNQWQFPGWDFFFKESTKGIGMEYCSGNGDWIIAKAVEHPQKNWIAVEKRFDRVRKIWSKMMNLNISNLLIIFGEAEVYTEHYLPSESIEEIYINFPDPWPKRRHAKNRLVQKKFIDLLSPVLKINSTITMATDDFPYSQQMIAETMAHDHFSSNFHHPYYISEWKDYGNSWFEDLWRDKGRTIYYLQFKKNQ